MRIALSIILLATGTAFAMEIIVSDAKRTEMSAAVFSGIVTNAQHLPLLKTNAVGGLGNPFGTNTYDRGLWRADVVIGSVTKQDVPLGTVAVVYYEQRPIPPSLSMRICPGYPVIETNMHATFWCHRVTIDGLTNVLFVSMPSWVKSK
jgi:hypothetical protein